MKSSEFLEECAVLVGDITARRFRRAMHYAVPEWGIESPIEQMLYAALEVGRIKHELPDADYVRIGKTKEVIGFYISPQLDIGNYRVDFFISWGEKSGNHYKGKSLIVECDSQQWHERTPTERTYEKARDRFLVSEGYRVFHYTGQEITRKPWHVVAQILKEIGAI